VDDERGRGRYHDHRSGFGQPAQRAGREHPGRLEFRRGPDFAARSEVWLTAFNHNYLRLTRILRALNLLGCARHADTLFRALQDVYREHADAISEETFEYWQRAARR